ncbi:hypothetical protein FAEPRAM212_02311 [Faecalibacterium prausnitzii M21/2]|uniref:Uncharacterized protein n=1 Tax=Faecalibacterium prausnitzii M21/2 TaxID=411485 RepID=A8SDS2_9FIRM|nr:hypothetical protein FAEPRAM212_02311 [Faecalibacterium prausnitzii M21/2]
MSERTPINRMNRPGFRNGSRGGFYTKKKSFFCSFDELAQSH